MGDSNLDGRVAQVVLAYDAFGGAVLMGVYASPEIADGEARSHPTATSVDLIVHAVEINAPLRPRFVAPRSSLRT